MHQSFKAARRDQLTAGTTSDRRTRKSSAVRSLDSSLAVGNDLGTDRWRAAGFRQLRLIRRGQNCNQDVRLSLDGLGNCQLDLSCESLRSCEYRTDRTRFGIVWIGVVGRVLSGQWLLGSPVNMPMPVGADGDRFRRVCVGVTMHSALFAGDQVPAAMPQCHQQGIATQDCPAEDRRWGIAQHEQAVRNGTFLILLRTGEQSQR